MRKPASLDGKTLMTKKKNVMRKEYDFDGYISPRKAYLQGMDAFTVGNFDNPHKPHTIHAKEWERGWNAAYELNYKDTLWMEGKADEAKEQEAYLRRVGIMS